MTDEHLVLVTCVLVGLAASLAMWGGRGRVDAWVRRERQWIEATYLRFSPEPINAVRLQYLYTALRAGVLAVLLLLVPNLLIALLIWGLALLIPKQVVDMLWERRRRKIDDQIPLAVMSMSQSIQAGLTLVQSIDRLAEKAPTPIRTEFRIMSNRYALGADFDQTIADAQRRLNLPNINLFAAALLVNREMGGNVAATLERIGQSLDKLKELRQTVKASTSEGRTNIKALACAPVAVVGLLYFLDPEGVALLFNTIHGLLLLVFVAMLTGLGIFWGSRIVGSEL